MLSSRIARPCLTCRFRIIQTKQDSAKLSTLGQNDLAKEIKDLQNSESSPKRDAARSKFALPGQEVKIRELDHGPRQGHSYRKQKESFGHFNIVNSLRSDPEEGSGESGQSAREGSIRNAGAISRHDAPQRHHGGQRTSRRTEDFENIPFESEKILQRVSNDAEAAKSTMTDREKGVFEKLARLQPTQPLAVSEQQEPSADEQEGNIEVIEAESSPEAAPPTQQKDSLNDKIKKYQPLFVPRAMEPDLDSMEPDLDSVEPDPDSIQRELDSIHVSLEAAETDTKLWLTLLDLVISRALRLNLDKLSIGFRKDLYGKHHIPLPVKTFPPRQKAKILPIFSKTFTHHLTNFMEVIQRKFPNSTYGFAIFPFLRGIGPATFALGASTRLYNAHMFVHWTKYRDLTAIRRVLQEMHRDVYLYDGGTQTLVTHIIREAERGLAGVHGEAVKRLYEMSREELRKLRGIRRQIVEQREEEALREARVKESDGSEWEGEIEIEVEKEEVEELQFRRVAV